jgi:hypothetical protein
MTMLMAIAHLVGAFVALFFLAIICASVTLWWVKKSEANAVEELSVALGVTAEKLKSEEVLPHVLKLQGERFSSELLRNRLSDLCGWLAFGWFGIGLLVTVGGLLLVAWNTFTGNLDEAIFAWVMIPIALAFLLSLAVFALVCRLLTGRYPGQARHARKELSDFIKTHKAV